MKHKHSKDNAQSSKAATSLVCARNVVCKKQVVHIGHSYHIVRIRMNMYAYIARPNTCVSPNFEFKNRKLGWLQSKQIFK